MPKNRVQVCFVCLGNICRSPTAEGVMRRIIDELDLGSRIEIDSAGTAAYHTGELPDERARRAARDRGIELASRARQFVAADFTRFDYVLAMDQENLENLGRLYSKHQASAGSQSGVLALLRDFDPETDRDAEIADPYYGGERGFEEVLDQCEAACRGLVDAILGDQGLE